VVMVNKTEQKRLELYRLTSIKFYLFCFFSFLRKWRMR